MTITNDFAVLARGAGGGITFRNRLINGNMAIDQRIYLNGTTDFVELYCYQESGSSVNTNAYSDVTYFQGVMVRGA
jgi:hypothetical protein